MKTENDEDIKRLILLAGGKGGVGKTIAAVGIAEYLKHHEIPLTIIDCDIENQKRGGICTFLSDATKLDIRSERGLDIVLNHLLESPPKIGIADLGGGSGQDTFKWFGEMGSAIRELKIKVTLVAVVTPDPAAIQTLFNWSYELRNSCEYLVIKNLKDGDKFPYLDETEDGKTFMKAAKPAVIFLKRRPDEIQGELTNRRLTLGQALGSTVEICGPKLNRFLDQARMRTYFNDYNAQLDTVRKLLLP